MKSLVFGAAVGISLGICGQGIADWQFWVSLLIIVSARVVTMEPPK